MRGGSERRGPGAHPRLRGDAGVAVIETALITPILLFLLMAVFEYGVVFRDLLGANDAVEAGAKYGSIQGPDLVPLTTVSGVNLGEVSADYTIVYNTRAGLAGIEPELIERIVIFKAGPPARGSAMQQVPAACKTATGSIDGVCNVYPMPAAFQQIERGTAGTDSFNAARVVCPGQPPCGWKASARDDGPNPNDVDHLGVYVKMRRRSLTGLVPAPTMIEAASVHRLELGEAD